MHDELKQIISQAMNTRFEFEQKLIQRVWEDENFKEELLSNPQAVYARESGEELPKNIEVEVLQETANLVSGGKLKKEGWLGFPTSRLRPF